MGKVKYIDPHPTTNTTHTQTYTCVTLVALRSSVPLRRPVVVRVGSFFMLLPLCESVKSLVYHVL